MKAARLFGIKDMKIVEVPDPRPGAGDVVCRVKRAGICGTDYSIFTGQASFVKEGLVSFPITMGHEWSGVVESVGREVRRFRPGDPVVGDAAVSCGVCGHCLMGNYYQCAKLRCVGTLNTWDGAFAELIVMPERHLFPLPGRVDFDQAAMVEPAATALYTVRLAGVTAGDTVIVHGSGPIGIMAASFARMCGAARVVITGRKEFKLEMALETGADAALNITRDGWEKELAEMTGGTVDRILETSGSPELLRSSVATIRTGGTLSVVAFYEKRLDDIDFDRLVLNGITVKGVSGSLGMFGPVLSAMAEGRVDFRRLITGRCRLEEIPETIAALKTAPEKKIKTMAVIED